MEVYAVALVAVGSAFVAGLVLAGWGVGNLWMVVALAGVAAVAERGTIKVSANHEESISLLPTLFAAVLFGPLAAMIVSAASMIGDFNADYPRRRLRWTVYTASRAITGALAGLGATAAQGSTDGFGRIMAATLAGVMVAETVDAIFGSIPYRLRGHGRALHVLRGHLPVALASVPLYAPVVALLALAYDELSNWTLLLFFVPTLAAQRLFALYQEQRHLAVGLAEANDRLERANLSFATALVTTLDARDQYTAGHSAAVAVYARDIAERMALSEEERQLAHVCGLVHDIGKIGLAAGLLEKPGPLTLEERRQMERHSEIGERILDKVDGYEEIARIVRHHHERVDGHGYPDNLRGEEIPLLSRIIAVADAYNAMTSDRPYRDAMPSRVARLRLAQAVESQFDTSVVAAFEALLAGASEAYRSGSHADFTLEAQDALALASGGVAVYASA